MCAMGTAGGGLVVWAAGDGYSSPAVSEVFSDSVAWTHCCLVVWLRGVACLLWTLLWYGTWFPGVASSERLLGDGNKGYSTVGALVSSLPC